MADEPDVLRKDMASVLWLEPFFLKGTPASDASTGGGIQFDTDNEGGWLYINTNGPVDASPVGYGIGIYDGSGQNIEIGEDNGGELRLNTSGGGNLTLDSSYDIRATANHSVVLSGQNSSLNGTNESGVTAGDAAGIAYIGTSSTFGGWVLVIQSEFLGFYHSATGNPTDIVDATPFMTIDLRGGSPTYHIAAGASWVADL